MPGVGKTTVGQLVANRLRKQFVDMDAEVELSQKRPIADIVSEHGADYFRSLESRLLERLSTLESKSGLVVATGGGVPISKHNRRLMRSSGVVVCLTLTIQELINRLANSTQVRPWIGMANDQPSLKVALDRLLNQRRTVYAEADLSISISQLKPEQACELVCRALKNIPFRFKKS